MSNLPGVENDKEDLVKILSKYEQNVTDRSNSVLGDLRKIVEKYNETEFDRVHFHFSGKIL